MKGVFHKGHTTDPRRKLQAYQTPGPVAAKLVKITKDWVKANVPQSHRIHWVEPSAGQGAFFRHLPTKRRTAIDTDRKYKGEKGYIITDFLKWSPPTDRHWPATDKVVVIGNPPFSSPTGGDLALRFIQHAAQWAHTVAMILPASFMRKSRQNRIPRHFKLARQIVLPRKTFHNARNPAGIQTVFQIWHWSASVRRVTRHVLPSTRLQKVKYSVPWNLCVYRMGDPNQVAKPYTRKTLPAHLRKQPKSYLWYFHSHNVKRDLAIMKAMRPKLVTYYLRTSCTKLLNLSGADFAMYYNRYARGT